MFNLLKPFTRYCGRCGGKVKREFRIREYPYYCPSCDENMYGIETFTQRELDKAEQKSIEVLTRG